MQITSRDFVTFVDFNHHWKSIITLFDAQEWEKKENRRHFSTFFFDQIIRLMFFFFNVILASKVLYK